MSRITALPLLIAAAALAAALFGALHNQLSFTVGPAYFHALKFPQFGVEDLPDRLAAAVVGAQASWWMGVLMGLPAFLYGLVAMPRTGPYLAAGIGAIGVAVLVTTAFALGGLALGMGLGDHPRLAFVASPEGADRTEFLRAALMHQASYIGGVVGALAALLTMRRAAIITRGRTGNAA